MYYLLHFTTAPCLGLRLQYQFGLRRQESIKFIVSQADQGLYINECAKRERREERERKKQVAKEEKAVKEKCEQN